jgi:hypothetical protein
MAAPLKKRRGERLSPPLLRPARRATAKRKKAAARYETAIVAGVALR